MTTEQSINSKPIFLHSLFRAGSTYFFNVFRRLENEYSCYQEPLHEYLIHAAYNPQKLLEVHHEAVKYLRHPILDRPYFYEFYAIHDQVAKLFRKTFSYDQYFCASSHQLQELKIYFNALIEPSKGRAFLQCCRTSGRIPFLKSEFAGTHIFLWRNPWDQWWSYRLGFDTNNLLILNSIELPGYLRALKEELNIPEFHDDDIDKEYSFYSKRWLSAENSYKLFFALWCYASLEALPECDFSISIDSLSLSIEYRLETYKNFQNHGIDISRIDLSDCNVPQGLYGPLDADFFEPVEDQVYALLISHGYSESQIENLKGMRLQHQKEENEQTLVDKTRIRDAMRARSIALQLTTEISQGQKYAWELESKVQNLEQALQSSQQHQQQTESTLQQTESTLQQTESTLQQTELMLQTLTNSRSMRITAPLRTAGKLVRIVKNRIQQSLKPFINSRRNIMY